MNIIRTMGSSVAATIVASLLLFAAPEAAAAQCGLQFEVATPFGAPVPAKRVSRTADADVCEFDVRLQPTDATCPVGQLVVRGLQAPSASAGWERQRIRPRGRRTRRRLLRARMAGSPGPAGKARLALRCAARPALAGCENVLAESAHCYLGGGERVRLAGLDSGRVCPRTGDDRASALVSRDFAVFEGDAYTCAGSAAGGFVATPIDGGPARVVAGACEATTTDGESLFVLPALGFDTPPSRKLARVFGVRGRTQLAERTTEIRAYAFPEAVPAGQYEVAADLADIPADSPCAGIRPDVLAVANGAIYAAGCRPNGFGGCTPIEGICVLGSADGAFLGSAGGAFVRHLELEDFQGRIEGLSALDGGRLVVLAGSETGLPPVGYDGGGAAPASTPCRHCGGMQGPDALHVFDVLTGARLDSVSIETSGATGISCEAGGS